MKASEAAFEKLLTENASPGIRPGLSRIVRLLALIGNPQDAFRAFHVVGTNGKGSTCAFLNSILISDGYKTAFYSSPHLISPDERLLIDNSPLPMSDWLACGEEIVSALKSDSFLRSDPPSYFEILTAIAFKLAENARPDFAVVEAGLGGRLDATNTLGKIAYSIITSVSMDHTEYLGNTLEAIAGEKFAVVRDEDRAIYLGDSPLLCEKYKKLHILLRDAEIKINDVSLSGNDYDIVWHGNELKNLKTSLVGEYQIFNSALAVVAALSALPSISERAIRDGLQNASWIGRMEIVSRSPLVILDGAHNADGVAKLVTSLKKILQNDKKIGIVYAAMKDKDIAACLAHLGELPNSSLYLTRVPGNERSAVLEFDDPLEAFQTAKNENEIIIICGSLYFIGYIRDKIRGVI